METRRLQTRNARDYQLSTRKYGLFVQMINEIGAANIWRSCGYYTYSKANKSAWHNQK